MTQPACRPWRCGERVRSIRGAWAAVCKAAGITGLQFRDLRREFASRLRETPGIADHHVRDVLGHADLQTTSRYLATTRVGLQGVMTLYEQHQAGFAQDSHKGPRRGPLRTRKLRGKTTLSR